MIIPEALRDELKHPSHYSDSWEAQTTEPIEWVCLKDQRHIFTSSLHNRVVSPGCPICSNRRLIKGINDLATTHPDVVAQSWSTQNTVNPQDITSSYSKKLWWKCAKGHEYETKLAYRLRGTACPYCNGNKILVGFNDAETLYPQLVKEVSPNSPISLQEVGKGSAAKLLWRCQSGHEWEATVPSRMRGRNCPICSNKKVVEGLNDFATLYPNLVQQWHHSNSKNPQDVSKGSDYRATWVCPKNSSHIYTATVYKRTRDKNPTGCPYCNGKKVCIGDNDLRSQNPELAAEYSSNNPIPSDQITARSARNVWWKDSYGHEWKAPVKNRAKGQGCPVCSNRTVLSGFNDLATLHPSLAKEWDSAKNDVLLAEVVGSGKKSYWWRCSQGHSWKAVIDNRIRLQSGCPQCVSHVSKAETEVADFVRSVLPDTEVLTNTRKIIKPKELDIYIPSKHVAIEFHGLFWHTESAGKTRNYHCDKFRACEAKGVQLIQVWEDEWNNKQEIVKRMLASKLGVSQDKRVFARKTHVVTVDKGTARSFLDANHIQGYASGTYYLGLRTNDTEELVAVMVLRKLGNEFYLDRYATSCQVVGGQGKLLSWVHENLDFRQLVTFADLQVSNGYLYRVTGWTENKVLSPDYRYVVDGERVHKFNYRLKRFKNDPDLLWRDGLSERELALLNGLDRVWDSGKIRFVMPKRNS